MKSINPAKVLLVDDQPTNLLALEAALEEVDATLVRAVSGEEALIKAAGADFAAILLDVRMPGMDGFETARRLRAELRSIDTPILFVSAFDGGEVELTEAYALGAVDFLTKPVAAHVLRGKLAFFLDLYHRKEDLRQARQDALNDRALMAAVLEAVEDGIVACDVEGKFTIFNRASRQWHGLPQQAIPPEQWATHYALYRADGVTPLPTHEIPLVRALAGELVRNEEMVISPQGGERRTVSVTGQTLIDEAGRKTGAVVSMHDVTAEREAQLARESAIREQARREEAEAAATTLRESTERVALLLNSSGEGIYGMAPDSTCTFLNPAGALMLGYRSEELVGRPIHDVIHHHRPDGSHYPQSECKIGKASRAGTFARIDDEVFWHKDGSAVPVSYSVNPMVIDGSNAGAVITFTDVTERRRVEEALRASNERVKLASDAVGLGLFTWEPATDFVTWHNDRPYEIFGIPKKDGPLNASRFVSQFLQPDDAEGFARAMAVTLEEQAPLYFRGRIRRLSDQELRSVEFTGRVQPTADGASMRVVGTVADITLRLEAERALRDSEERLRKLANTIPNLAWMANADGWITWYNDRWYEYTGTTASEMEGWGWQTVHDPDVLPRVMQRWTDSINTGQAFEMTFPLRGTDGTYRPFLTLVAPLRDSTGKIVQWFGTNTDVSPLKRAEDELREADRRKDEFLAMLAHELRNPLAPIRNAAEVLHRLDRPDRQVTDSAEVIARQVNHMAGLLNDLLDVSRVTRGLINLERRPVDLATVVADAVEQARPLIEAKQHRLTVNNHHPGTHVFASPIRLTQVIANLLDNAAKYSPPQGTITVEVRRLDEQVVIAVSDTGLGIPADLLPRVFEPFSQAERGADRSQGGLGLGLAVVKGLVELHGGTVAASSEGAGKGSRLEVVLPVCDPTSTSDPPSHAESFSGVASREALDVLVVDDNVDAAQTLALVLEASGHRTEVAFTATEGLALIQQRHFDAAILDIGLPDFTGHELASKILATVPLPPTLIALSGYAQTEDRATALAAGFAQYLVKPVEPAMLMKALSALP